MLSLVLGSDITDASVAAIASTYSKLELLDLSGYLWLLSLLSNNSCVNKLIFRVVYLISPL